MCFLLKDVVDPIIDEMLATFVVDSHFKSKPSGSNIDDRSTSNSQEDADPLTNQVDPEVVLYIGMLSLISYMHLICDPEQFLSYLR